MQSDLEQQLKTNRVILDAYRTVQNTMEKKMADLKEQIDAKNCKLAEQSKLIDEKSKLIDELKPMTITQADTIKRLEAEIGEKAQTIRELYIAMAGKNRENQLLQTLNQTQHAAFNGMKSMMEKNESKFDTITTLWDKNRIIEEKLCDLLAAGRKRGRDDDDDARL